MRLPLIPPDRLDDVQRPLAADMRDGIDRSFQGFTAKAPDGTLLGPWNPWIHYPRWGGPVWELVQALAGRPTLPKPVREVAILVTGARFDSAYELYAHILVAEARGLDEDTIATIAAGQRPANLPRDCAIAYDVAAVLAGGRVLPELNWRQAVDAFGQEGAGELIYLVGLYAMVSVTLNGFDVPVPEAVPPA